MKRVSSRAWLGILALASLGILSGCSSDSAPTGEMNHTPSLAAIGAQEVSYNDTLIVEVSATDPDGTIPSLGAIDLPLNSAFVDHNDGSGTFEFLPDSTQEQTHVVTFFATDGAAADSEEVIIEVTRPVNHKPVLDPIPPYQVLEGENLNFIVSASDVDGDSIELTASGMPANATFVDHGDGTATFDFTPDFTQQGLYTVWITAHDGSASDFKTAYIEVIDAGD